MGHFSRECQAQGRQNSNTYQIYESKEARKDGSDLKAMVVVDGSIDWDKQTEEGNTEPRSLENFGMIDGIKIESNADSEGEVVSANDAILAGVFVSTSNVTTAVAKWNNSGRNLYKLIDSSMSVRTKQRLGLDKYIGEGELGIDDSKVSIFHTNSDDLEGQPIYNRFALVDHIKAVPPPLTGNYMPRSNIPDIDKSQMVYRKKATDSSEIKTNVDSISYSNDSVLFDFSDRDTIVIDSDRQEDFPSVCSIETDVKSSKTLCNKFGSFNKESHFRKHKSVASKSCYVCGSYLHLIKDCDLHEQRFAIRNAEGKGILGRRSIGKPVNPNRPKPVIAGRPNLVFAEQQNPVFAGQLNPVFAGQPNPVSAGQPNTVSAGDGILGPRPLNIQYKSIYFHSFTHNNQKIMFPITHNSLYLLYLPGGLNGKAAVKPLAGWPWTKYGMLKTKGSTINGGSKSKSWSYAKGPLGRPKSEMTWAKDRGIVDSGCSQSISGNKDKQEDFEDFDGEEVTFGGSTRKISRKGTIKTKTLYFKNVLYVKELQHFNLISVSPICDQTHRVLFTENECLVLSNDFPLPDPSMVILSILRKRLGHVNFRNMNKLVKGNLVRGLPSKRTKHIEIRPHFIKDANEKKLIQVLKIPTEDNVADLLTKSFVVTRFGYLVVNIDHYVAVDTSCCSTLNRQTAHMTIYYWKLDNKQVTIQFRGRLLGIVIPAARYSVSVGKSSFLLVTYSCWKRSKQRIKEFNLDELSPPIVTMADQRTMSQLLQAPTEGYEDAIVVPAITADNFELKHELHQLDTFYNALNSKDQDSLNSAAGDNFLDKMPRECLAIIESKSKVCYSRNKPIVAKVSTNTSTFGISPDVAELKDMVKALLLDKKSQNQSPATVKAVEESCVTCGGAHSYRNCPATGGNVYHDNIQEFVSQASIVNYNQGNTNYRPSMIASTSSSGTLPSNTIANPRSDLKAITTRSGVSYEGPQILPPPSFLPKVVENKLEATKDTMHPTNNGSTEYVQPQVVQSESLILTSKPVTSPISEPVITPVNAPKPNPKSSIPYPSRRNDERNREKANNQIEKFYQIFKDISC
nr:ribonuclease H-like domain-containing protein [Tanacetum cinerariifolium]